MYERSNISTALQYPDPTLVRIRDTVIHKSSGLMSFLSV